MANKKYGIFHDLYPTSDLQFLREGALDPGDGNGLYSHRDQMLMMQLKAAVGPKKDRKALIWLIKHLLDESKARMTMLKSTQRIYLREKPDFYSPAPALEILNIGRLRLLTKEEEGRDICEGTFFPEDFGLCLGEPDRVHWFSTPIVGEFELWFLETALYREECPSDAVQLFTEWQDLGCLQPLRKWAHGLPPKQVPGDDVPRRPREDCLFKPGRSPNPNGRPKGSKNKAKQVRPDFFDEPMIVVVNGKRRRYSRRVAFLWKVKEQAIAQGDDEIMRLLLDRHMPMSKLQASLPYEKLEVITLSAGGIDPRSFEGAVQALGGGDLVYANSKNARMLLEPWLIELGFAHLGDRRLSREEQRIVLYFSRHPKRTNWPDWWEPDLRKREPPR